MLGSARLGICVPALPRKRQARMTLVPTPSPMSRQVPSQPPYPHHPDQQQRTQRPRQLAAGHEGAHRQANAAPGGFVQHPHDRQVENHRAHARAEEQGGH